MKIKTQDLGWIKRSVFSGGADRHVLGLLNLGLTLIT